MPEAVVDTNILVRYLTNRPEALASRVAAILEEAERRGVALVVTPVVLAEIIHVLESSYRWPRHTVAAGLAYALAVPALHILERAVVERAVALYRDHSGLDFADAYVAALAVERGHGRVVSFDEDFRRLPGVRVIRDAGDLPPDDGPRRRR